MNSRGRTQTHAALVWRRLRRSRTAVAGLVIVGVYLFLALCGPWLAPYDPYFQDLNISYLRPCMAHWLGCDEFGRDILSRLLYGARVSLVIQFWAVMISLAVGTFLGSASGYFGGKVDEIVMRLMDVMMAFPGILLALAIVAILGPSLTNLIVAIGINSVPGFSRVARGVAQRI